MSLQDETFKMLTKDPDDWEITKYHAMHKKTKLKYWIGNGLICFRIDSIDVSVSLGFFNWIALYFWIKEAQRIKILKGYGNKN